MKVLIVSGFLGAGKTTFIREMAKKSRHDFAVMENEYGDASIDRAALESDSSLNIWELTEGCICCSTKTDFASSVLTVANTIDPEYLVVEPTGVGMLSNIILNLQKIQYERISLLRPVTLLDAQCFDLSVSEYGDIFKDQIRSTGTILISKQNFSSSEDMQTFLQKVHEIDPKANVLPGHYSSFGPDFWETLLSTDLDGNSLLPQKRPEEIPESLTLHQITLPSASHLLFFLEDVIRHAYGNIYRAKGVVAAGNARLRFDVVGSQYSVTGCLENDPLCGVFIGKELQRNKLRRTLLPDFHTDPKTIRIRR